MPASEPDRAALAETLTAAVREAGALALSKFRTPLKHWTKGKDSPVTESDIAVDALLKERLLAGGFGWLSEETEDDIARLDHRFVWVIDSIDGTRAYLAGETDWSVSAALVENGRPVIGALFAPAENDFFLAVLGEGATCNGEPIRATDGASLAGARVSGPKRTLERLVGAEPGLVAMPRVHSLALRLARVAQGRLDGAVAGGNSHDWDLAAADLLVHEAGGVVTGIDGRTPLYNKPDPVHGPLIVAGATRGLPLRNLVKQLAP